MRVLELYSGTQSIGKEFKKLGHTVLSVEVDDKFTKEPYCLDQWTISIADVTAKEVIKRLGGVPDVIWASPLCTTFSMAASSGNHRQKINGLIHARSVKAHLHDSFLIKTLELIAELNPRLYFIENPQGGMKNSWIMQEFNSKGMHTVTYCQYNNKLIQELIFNMKIKKCPKCGETKDIDNFYKNNSRKDGFASWCKECSNQSHELYVENNKEKLKQYDKVQYWKNPEKHRESRIKSNKKNKESIDIARIKYMQNNKDKIAEKHKIYHFKNKEHRNNMFKKRYELNSEEYKNRARERKYKIKEISDGTVTLDFEKEMYVFQNGKCAYCQIDLETSGKHLDHILPISKGGLHTSSNVHWTCPTCNLEKKDKTEEEWLRKERMKPTNIWTNHPNPKFKPRCYNGDTCHESAPRGSKTGTQGLSGSTNRSVIPEQLCQHIVKISEE